MFFLMDDVEKEIIEKINLKIFNGLKIHKKICLMIKLTLMLKLI